MGYNPSFLVVMENHHFQSENHHTIANCKQIAEGNGKIVVEKSIEALEFGLLGDLFFVPWDDSWWLMVSFFGWIPSYETQYGRRGLS